MLSTGSLALAIISPKLLWLLITVLSAYLFLRYLRLPSNLEPGNYYLRASVVKIGEKYAILNVKNNYFLLYTNKYTSAEALRVGYLVNIKGVLNPITEQKNFYYANRIDHIFEKAIVERVDKPLYSTSQLIDNWSNQSSEIFKQYWKLIVFGFNYDSYQLTKNAISVNILHLLVISGLHFDILFRLVLWPIKKINNAKYKKIATLLSFLVLFYYLCMLANFVSGLRAFVMQFFKIKHPKLNIYSMPIAALIIFYMNPSIILSISFILSFSTTLFIILINKSLGVMKIKHKIIKFLILATIIYITSLIWTLKLNGFINITGLIFANLFSPIIQLTYTLSILFWFIPVLLHYVYLVLNFLILLAQKYSLIWYINANISHNSILIWLVLWSFILSIPLFYRHKRKKTKN